MSDVGNQAWPKPCSSMEISNVINILSKRGYFLIEETINVRVFRDAFNAILKFFDLFSSYISCQIKNIYILYSMHPPSLQRTEFNVLKSGGCSFKE